MYTATKGSGNRRVEKESDPSGPVRMRAKPAIVDDEGTWCKTVESDEFYYHA
jgi:hypothetical protein